MLSALNEPSMWAQVRAKYMALEPSKNRYVKYMRAIRVIQDYLVARAARHAVPSVNNTNVDRSVATIHATTLACLRRQARVRPRPSRSIIFVDIPQKWTLEPQPLPVANDTGRRPS